MDPEGHSPLMRAVEQQCLPCVERLITQKKGEYLVDQTLILLGAGAGEHHQNSNALALSVTGDADIVAHLCEYLDEDVANARSGSVKSIMIF